MKERREKRKKREFIFYPLVSVHKFTQETKHSLLGEKEKVKEGTGKEK